ncbi:neuronal acetylcholine receptor subunit alpha-9 isoform X1 [Lingula anatina]|uniref:Neuronal acetylcholine receptor subunit alpha-9 isoform X1 n=1 Tax=Lingula anatina TaxID=7574 RepID=A0A1S3K4A1_LINAN|nr:neuronal acetylcholine receptor subunit alpha-9 isoform X1 [Lingula anatina]|eukprot:XP_013417352.1 neuronal acetylcholine receptor subunit alpha-9 isoform X1 [Lingula anatina]
MKRKIMNYFMIWALTSSVWQVCASSDDFYAAAYKLKKNLFENYDATIRPVKNKSETVVVYLDISVNQVIEMNAAEQILFLSFWLRQKWRDEMLSWNATEHSNITQIDVALEEIWKPDITIYNDVREEERDVSAYPASVSSDGTVSWKAPIILKSSCIIDIYNFPNDRQSCPIKFGSWHYNGFQLDIQNQTEYGDTKTFVKNGEWRVGVVPAVRTVQYYSCCPEPYPDVTYYIVMCRKPLYYIYNLILPCIVILIMTAISFYLPVESGEKVSFGVTAVLAMMVFLQLVSDLTPTQSDVVPILSLYLTCVLALLCASTLTSIIVSSIHFKGEKGLKLPRWAQKFAIFTLAPILCMKNDVNEQLGYTDPEEDPYEWLTKKLAQPNGVDTRKIKYGAKQSGKQGFSNPAFQVENTENNNSDPYHNTTLVLHEIHRTLRGDDFRGKEAREEARTKTEWQLAASVVDRFVMYIYILLTIALTAWCFAISPPCDPNVFDGPRDLST